MFVSKKKCERLIEDFEDSIKLIERESLQKSRELQSKEVELGHAKEIIEKLTIENQQLKTNLISEEDAETSASVFISDDLKTVRPVTKVKPSVVNKMVELGYLPYNKRDDEFAINLAAMMIAYEGLEQLIFTFEESLRDGVSMEGQDDEEA